MKQKNDKIKIVIVVILSLILITSAYFRLVKGRKKTPAPPPPKVAKIAPGAENLKISMAPKKSPSREPSRSYGIDPAISTILRDVFVPMVIPAKAKPVEPKPEPEVKPPPPQFNLKGTIAGGKNPIAIIDNQFVRKGDWIKGYQVVMIGKKEVHLDSGVDKMTLEILKND